MNLRRSHGFSILSDQSDNPDIDSTRTILPYMYEPVTNSGNNRTHVFDQTDHADHAIDLSLTSILISLEWFVLVLNQVLLQYINF